MEPVVEALKVANSQIRSHPCRSIWIKRMRSSVLFKARPLTWKYVPTARKSKDIEGRWESLAYLTTPQAQLMWRCFCNNKLNVRLPLDLEDLEGSRSRGGSPCWQTPRRMTWNPQWPLKSRTPPTPNPTPPPTSNPPHPPLPTPTPNPNPHPEPPTPTKARVFENKKVLKNVPCTNLDGSLPPISQYSSQRTLQNAALDSPSMLAN